MNPDPPEDTVCYQDRDGRWRCLDALRSELEEAIRFIERTGGWVATINGHWYAYE